MESARDPRRTLLAYAPHFDTFGYSMPPPGLLRLGGTLEAAGFEVALEDLAYRLGAGDVHGDERLAESCADWLLARGDHGVIGFSTMGATLPASVAIAEIIRELASLAHNIGAYLLRALLPWHNPRCEEDPSIESTGMPRRHSPARC